MNDDRTRKQPRTRHHHSNARRWVVTTPAQSAGRDGLGYERCGAAKRQEPGGVCTQAAGWGTDHPGVGRCKLHGGNTPNQRESARRLMAEAAARRFATPVDIKPDEALLHELQVSFGVLEFYRAKVRELGDDAMIRGWTSARRTVKTGMSDVGRPVNSDETVTLAESKPHVWVQLLQAAERHHLEVVKVCMQVGITSHVIDLLKQTAAVWVQMILTALERFGIEGDDPRIPVIVPEIIQRATIEAPGPLEGGHWA